MPMMKWFATLLLCLAACARIDASSFTFADFSSTAGLTLVGAATPVGGVLQLTPDQLWTTGAAIFNQRQPVVDGFSTSFTFRMSSSGTPADGMVFLVENAAPWFNQPAGGALDYYGLPNSLAVEFDTWQNGPYADPNANHIAVQSCGVSPNTPDHSAGCALGMRIDPGITLADGAAHTVDIRYIPGTLGVLLDGTSIMTVPLQIDTKLSLPDGQAWVAMAAATGGSSERAELLTWSFQTGPNTNTPEPATALIVGVGLVAVGLVRCRHSRP
jgi:hypothetical protein